jgi:hypothetical protein
MIRMRVCLLVPFLLLPAPAFAGGVSSLFTVEQFSQVSAQEATIVLRPVESLSYFPESTCAQLSVTARFARESLSRSKWTRELVTEAAHAAALQNLATAATNHTPIRFGSMGSGLAPVGTDRCVTKSEGLAVFEEPGGSRAVYSFHGPH